MIRLAAPLHLRLLMTLCNDVANGSALRAEFAARIDEAAQMQTQHRQLLIEVGPKRACPSRQAGNPLLQLGRAASHAHLDLLVAMV